jgi:hypothetical protein
MDKNACITQLLVGAVTLLLVVSAGVYVSKQAHNSGQQFHAAAAKE